jgi:hypothetical protein
LIFGHFFVPAQTTIFFQTRNKQQPKKITLQKMASFLEVDNHLVKITASPSGRIFYASRKSLFMFMKFYLPYYDANEITLELNDPEIFKTLMTITSIACEKTSAPAIHRFPLSQTAEIFRLANQLDANSWLQEHLINCAYGERLDDIGFDLIKNPEERKAIIMHHFEVTCAIIECRKFITPQTLMHALGRHMMIENHSLTVPKYTETKRTLNDLYEAQKKPLTYTIFDVGNITNSEKIEALYRLVEEGIISKDTLSIILGLMLRSQQHDPFDNDLAAGLFKQFAKAMGITEDYPLTTINKSTVHIQRMKHVKKTQRAREKRAKLEAKRAKHTPDVHISKNV